MIEFQVFDWVVLNGKHCQILHIGPSSVIVEDGTTTEARTVTRAQLESAEIAYSPLPQVRGLASVGVFETLSSASRSRGEAIAGAIEQVLGDSAISPSRARRLRALLAETGIEVSERQTYRYLAAFKNKGVAGVIDNRRLPTARKRSTDDRLIEIVEAELIRQQAESTGSKRRTIRRVRWEAARRGVPTPSDRTFYRLFEELDRHRGSFGSAVTRRSKAVRPDRTFRPLKPSRPGEVVEIDSTPLDVFVLFPDGTVGRPELTYALDVATGTLCGTLLKAKPAKGVDIGAVLLTRMLTRPHTQPWWADAVRLAKSLVAPNSPHLESELEEMAAHAPLIVPESVTVDRGKVFVGTTFTAACERLEISQTRANPRQGTDKPHIEGGFKRIREGFVQYLSGYTGGNVQDRGADPRADAVWTLNEVQLLLDLWVITTWQTTPQSGLRLPGMPRRTLSPNQMYAALSAAAPQAPVHLTRDEYIALLPLAWRTVQPYGINFDGLTYDSDDLHPMRGRRSGVGGEAAGKWEVRYDPYNLRQIWVRDHWNDRWVTAHWGLAPQSEHPFSHEVLRAAQRAVAREQSQPTTLDLLEHINRVQRSQPRPPLNTDAVPRADETDDLAPATPIVLRAVRESRSRHAGAVETTSEPLPTARLRLLD